MTFKGLKPLNLLKLLKSDNMNDKTTINKNTYYMLPMWFIRACISISRAKSGKYLLTKGEHKKGYFLELTSHNITLNVPFRALFMFNESCAISPTPGFK